MADGDQDWVAKRVAEALKEKPVGETVSSIVQNRLRDTLCVKPLTKAELTAMAKALVDAAIQPPGTAADDAH